MNNQFSSQNLLASQTVRVNNVKSALTAGFITVVNESVPEKPGSRQTINIAALTQSWLMDKDMNLTLFDKYLHWIPSIPMSQRNIECLKRTTNVLLVVSLYQSLSRTPVVKINLTTDSHRLRPTDPWTEEQLAMWMTFGQERLKVPDTDTEKPPVKSNLFLERDPDGTEYQTEWYRLTEGLNPNRDFGRHKTFDFDEYLVESTRPHGSRRWVNMSFTLGHVIAQVVNPYDQHASSGQ